MISQVQHWNLLSIRLGFQVVSPISLHLMGTPHAFAAMLPQFGAPAGIVVDPDWLTIEPVHLALNNLGYAYSCVALDEKCDDRSAVEMLADWGWNGTGERPRFI